MYDPAIGRFLTTDPAESGRNWGAYCDNNPVLAADPSGCQTVMGDNFYTTDYNHYLAYGCGIYTEGDNQNFFTNMARQAPRGNVISGELRIAFSRGDTEMEEEGLEDLLGGVALEAVGALGGGEGMIGICSDTAIADPIIDDELAASADAAGDGIMSVKPRVNRLTPDANAVGEHTTFNRDGSGRIDGYREWGANPHNPTWFDSGARFDGTGKAHGVGTPHVHPLGKGPARVPFPWEMPLGY